jgi:hypothetical protein
MLVFVGYLRAHRGADANAMMPAYAWTALLFGVALARLCRRLEARGTAEAHAVVTVLLLAAMMQMAQHYYSPMNYVPGAEERAARDRFEGELRRIPGEVMVESHPEYGLMAGKQQYASSEAIGAVIEAKSHANGDKLMTQYAELIHSGELSAVALDFNTDYFQALPRVWMPRDFAKYYPVVVTDAGGDQTRFTAQPKYIYFPCPQPGKVDAARLLDAKADESACAGR